MELLGAYEVGRLAFNDDEGVAAGELRGRRRHSPGHDLPHGTACDVRDHRPVAFEVDEADDYTESGWSVLVRGTAAVVPANQLRGTAAYTAEPWVEGDRTLALRITPRQITGRRLFPA